MPLGTRKLMVTNKKRYATILIEKLVAHGQIK
jgi:hypothetical protein